MIMPSVMKVSFFYYFFVLNNDAKLTVHFSMTVLKKNSQPFPSGLVVDGCKTMDSAKMPLWLVFETTSHHGKPPMPLLFKVIRMHKNEII